MNPDTQNADPQNAAFQTFEPARIEELNRLQRALTQLNLEDREQRRYAAAAKTAEPCLCTPVDYASDLGHIPQRILDIDYGCGDPTQYAREGETVLDLGSGSGKHCFMIARKVGPDGAVIGVDKTPDMLELSRGAIDEVVGNLGYPNRNIDFRRGQIENLRWDLDRLLAMAAESPPQNYADLDRLERELSKEPLLADESVDLVVSNCVLNLVEDHSKDQLFRELHRVLRRGGRAVISDIVAAEDVPQNMKDDEDLWTGCVSGALRRDRFLQAFADAGFYGVEELSSYYWTREGDITFHSVTVVAHKGKEGPCWETYRRAQYRGPFSAVHDDDGHIFPRGVAVPVCEKTANLLSREPYAQHFLVSEALIDESEKIPFDCSQALPEAGELPKSIQEAAAKSVGLVSGTKQGPLGSGCDPATGCC